MITIIDYNAGNLASVHKALKFIGCECQVANDHQKIKNSDALILPGVGAFAYAVNSIDRLQLRQPIIDFINSGKPFLGICLGMQLLFESSSENPGVKGLGVFNGEIKRFPQSDTYKVPHMGWNSIEFQKESILFQGIDDNPYVYFVHSYYLDAKDKSIVSSKTNYSVKFDASIEKDNVTATQFHPEKSGDVGIKMLKNFCKNIVEG